MQHFVTLDTILGPMWIAENGKGLTHVDIGQPLPIPEAKHQETPLLRAAMSQLMEYLSGTRKAFDLPLDPPGTTFHQAVWQALRQIPYGETRTYGEIALVVGRPKAARAVGMANNKNPLIILTPCHRVIGAGGDLVGFGAGLDVKKALLALEQTHK